LPGHKPFFPGARSEALALKTGTNDISYQIAKSGFTCDLQVIIRLNSSPYSITLFLVAGRAAILIFIKMAALLF